MSVTEVHSLLDAQLAKRSKKLTVCLVMIVRNESRIIERLLRSLLGKIHYICVCDTGSTDNTRELIEAFGAEHALPTKVWEEPFRDFGYNRTLSCKLAQETFPDSTWLLLSDADHEWGGELPSLELLTADVYSVQQRSRNLSYWNVRLLRTALQHECVGVTHEYWQCVTPGAKPQLRLRSLYINDREDGGCKHDKFERDERLLRAGLEQPDLGAGLRTRYLFYLAQTLRCLGKYEESIDFYKQRAENGDSPEEVYYSLYSIGKNWESLKDFDKAKEAYRVAHEARPWRAEALYALCRLHRTLGENKESFDLALKGKLMKFPEQDGLFVDRECTDFLFDFELSIVSAYVGQKDVGAKSLALLLSRRDELPASIVSICDSNAKYYL